MTSALKPLVVINIVGLTPALLGENTPNINALIKDGFMANLESVFPAVTCSAQASMLTGELPSKHGIIANGWYYRELAEVWLWKQSNHLVKGEKIWDAAKSIYKDFTCAQLFWWFNMYANVDYSVTPRPIYPADGRKIPSIYTKPADLQGQLENDLAPFPLFNFWGPTADIRSSEWIAKSAKLVFDTKHPNLLLVYLPHLDYNLQRLGPVHGAIADDIKAIDQTAGDLIDHCRAGGAEVMVLSEYGIEPVEGHIHINRILRNHGFLSVRETLGWEMLDYGASRAFAVADHQVANIYVQNASDINQVATLLENTNGIDSVLKNKSDKAQWGIDHHRTGEIVVVAEKGFWFTYYYWLDDRLAPDFARTVDIHRKPGYDPVELFFDPELPALKSRLAWKLLKKKLGFRTLMDVIPLSPALVQGTHGRLPDNDDRGPLLIASNKGLANDRYAMTDIKRLILKHWA